MKQRPPLNSCMYCDYDGSELSDEHVIPRSICAEGHPDVILKKSSCKKCQKVTSRLEVVFKKHYRRVREVLGLKTYKRGKKKRKERTGLGEMRSKDGKKSINVPIKDSIPFILLPYYSFTPRLISGVEKSEIHETHEMWLRVLGGQGVDGFYSHVDAIKGNDYFRVYAKIAHAACVYIHGVDYFEPILLDFILKGEGDATLFMGQKESEKPRGEFNPSTLHEFTVEEMPCGSKIFCVVRLQLFKYYGSPEILIVVGEKKI